MGYVIGAIIMILWEPVGNSIFTDWGKKHGFKSNYILNRPKCYFKFNNVPTGPKDSFKLNYILTGTIYVT